MQLDILMKSMLQFYAMVKRKFFLGFLLWFLFLSIGIFTQSHYGSNWDEPTHFMRGQAYLHYFLTGKKDYSDLPNFKSYYQKPNTIFFSPIGIPKTKVVRKSIYQYDGLGPEFWLQNIPDTLSHPPLSDEIAAFSNYLFFQKLGLLNDIDSFNISIVFISSILVLFVYFWVCEYYGIFAAIVSTLSLSLYPLFLAESHYNIKDPPEAVFYALTLLTFCTAIIKKSNKWMLASSFLFGFALAIKYNIVFAPFVMVIWLCVYLIKKKKEISSYFKLLPVMILYPLIAFLVLVLSWPNLWSSTIKNFLLTVDFYKSIGIGGGFDSRYLTIFSINTYPEQFILFTTPLIILILSLAGCIFVFTRGLRERNKISFLIFVWLLVPILRVSMPQASIYGGVRQIMEYIPAMAILSGIGAFYLVSLIKEKFQTKGERIAKIFILLLFIPTIFKLISIHPNEGAYFNSLIGGLGGAKNKDIPAWGESLGNPYRQGINWINENAPKNSKVALTYGMGSNIPPILLRPDIDFSNVNRGATFQSGEYVIGMGNKSTLFDETYYSKYLSRFLIPVFEEKVDGVSVLNIWKNDKAHTRENFINEHLLGKVNPQISNTILLFDLKQVETIRKMVLLYSPSEKCEKNSYDVVTETSRDGNSWARADNGIGQRDIFSNASFVDGNKFSYYFAAESGRYIRFNFIIPNSCLFNVTEAEVYVL